MAATYCTVDYRCYLRVAAQIFWTATRVQYIMIHRDAVLSNCTVVYNSRLVYRAVDDYYSSLATVASLVSRAVYGKVQ